MPKNRIAALRKERGLTQRALADRVGTSQQQVQRIEAGLQGVRLELANKIAAAFGKELVEVFPALQVRRPRSSKGSKSVSERERLLAAGLDPDPRFWTVRFFAFDGRIFDYEVPSDEQARLEKIFSRSGNRIVVFSARTHWIAINQNKIAATQFLFDLGLVHEDEDDEEKFELKLHLISSEQPIVFGIEPETISSQDDDDGAASQMQQFFMQLEMNLEDELVDFYDEDRERVYLKPSEMLVVEVPAVCCEPALWEAEMEGLSETEQPQAPATAKEIKR